MIGTGRGFDSRQLHSNIYKKDKSMFDDDEETDEELITWLEEEGALNWAGMDDNGERVLTINPEKMREVYPELYAAMMQDLNDMLHSLMAFGYVERIIDDAGEERFSITEEGKKIMEKYGFGTNFEEGFNLND